MKLFVLFLSLAIPLFAGSAHLSNVTLYQPDAELRQRIGDVKNLAEYIKSLRTVCEGSFKSEDEEALDIVIVVKPNGKCRVWFVSTLQNLPDRSELKNAIEAVAAPSVKDGPIVFALSYDLNGVARQKPADGKLKPPMPEEWKAKIKDSKSPPELLDGVVKLVWPD